VGKSTAARETNKYFCLHIIFYNKEATTIILQYVIRPPSKNVKAKLSRALIPVAISYGCETWSPKLREELMVFENRVLRRMFGLNSDEKLES
jgi:hypothetical protein